ncbi:MAG: TspO/MBR family protein [Candidatus Yanofskybacteria bacterium]|nr:TspO/MBR family protein [Candidatus Yanofskybacteria bacterium]
MKETGKLLAAIGICQGAGIIGSFFVASSIQEWYLFLEKPLFSPPNWIFGPVWGTLYTLMGVSLYLVWKTRTKEECHCGPLTVFFFQLGFHALWPIVFFALRSPLLALLVLCVLCISLVWTTLLFWNVRKLAGALLIPSVLWVLFAAYLNFFLWRIN